MMAGRDGPLLAALTAVAVGAVLGAWLRWGLSYWLNPRLEGLPLGTLTANLVGGYLVGVAVAVFAAHPALPPFWRLLLVTGFLGGLTTFSAEKVEKVVSPPRKPVTISSRQNGGSAGCAANTATAIPTR